MKFIFQGPARRLSSYILAGFILVGVLLSSTFASAQNIAVSGLVTDVSGSAIAGATVKVRDSKLGVNTDNSGKFSLSLKTGAVLDVTAVGFNDTSVIINGQTPISIILRSKQNTLKDVSVNSNAPVAAGVDPIAYDQIMASTLSSYALESNFSNGVTQISGYNGRTPFHIVTFGMGPQNTLNNGAMLPYYMPKGETRGSKYLFPGYVGGVVVDSGNGLVQNAGPVYNFDKTSGTLLLRKDAGNYIEVGKDQVKGFALKSNDTTFIFIRVPAISVGQYYILVGAGTKYSVFKSLKTKFIKSNYVSNGLTESGNNYDEYIDEYEYYLVNAKDRGVAPVKFVIKKKAIKEAFGADAPKADAFFSEHRKDDIDDTFLKGLVGYVN